MSSPRTKSTKPGENVLIGLYKEHAALSRERILQKVKVSLRAGVGGLVLLYQIQNVSLVFLALSHPVE